MSGEPRLRATFGARERGPKTGGSVLADDISTTTSSRVVAEAVSSQPVGDIASCVIKINSSIFSDPFSPPSLPSEPS